MIRNILNRLRSQTFSDKIIRAPSPRIPRSLERFRGHTMATRRDAHTRFLVHTCVAPSRIKEERSDRRFRVAESLTKLRSCICRAAFRLDRLDQGQDNIDCNWQCNFAEVHLVFPIGDFHAEHLDTAVDLQMTLEERMLVANGVQPGQRPD